MQITALLEGRFNVSIDDIRSVALPALRHRVLLNFEGEAEGMGDGVGHGIGAHGQSPYVGGLDAGYLEQVQAFIARDPLSHRRAELLDALHGVSFESYERAIDAYDKAFKTDPTSAFGGIIAFNQTLDAETAGVIIERQFVEVIIAPAISDEALPVLAEESLTLLVAYTDWWLVGHFLPGDEFEPIFTPTGAILDVIGVAFDETFDLRALPGSGQPVVLTLHNEGALVHDFSIMEMPHAGEVVAEEVELSGLVADLRVGRHRGLQFIVVIGNTHGG